VIADVTVIRRRALLFFIREPIYANVGVMLRGRRDPPVLSDEEVLIGLLEDEPRPMFLEDVDVIGKRDVIRFRDVVSRARRSRDDRSAPEAGSRELEEPTPGNRPPDTPAIRAGSSDAEIEPDAVEIGVASSALALRLRENPRNPSGSPSP